jgi:hypothetical protein
VGRDARDSTMIFLLPKQRVAPLQKAKTHLVSAFPSGRARRITEVQEPETDTGHYCRTCTFLNCYVLRTAYRHKVRARVVPFLTRLVLLNLELVMLKVRPSQAGSIRA